MSRFENVRYNANAVPIRYSEDAKYCKISFHDWDSYDSYDTSISYISIYNKKFKNFNNHKSFSIYAIKKDDKVTELVTGIPLVRLKKPAHGYNEFMDVDYKEIGYLPTDKLFVDSIIKVSKEEAAEFLYDLKESNVVAEYYNEIVTIQEKQVERILEAQRIKKEKYKKYDYIKRNANKIL